MGKYDRRGPTPESPAAIGAVETAQRADGPERNLDDMVFIGFNRRVVALDRYSGDTLWDWKAPKGTGFVAIVLDGDRLIVSVQGYTYCLDPLFGQEVWSNPLKGYGIGIASVVTTRGSSEGGGAAANAQQQAAVGAAAGGGAAAAAAAG